MNGKVSNWHFVLAALALATLALTGRLFTAARAHRTGSVVPLNRILALSERVCRVCNPESSQISLYAEPNGTWSHGRQVGSVWCVECFGVPNRELAYLVWNAETGQLMEASVISRRRSSGRPIGPKSAIREAGGWMRRTGVSTASQRWTLNGSPEVSATTWRVVCHRGDEKAIVTVDRLNGDLITLLVYHG